MRGHGFGFGGLFGPELAPKGRRSAGSAMAADRRASWRLCPDRRHERVHPEDVDDARQIVGKYVQGHLGGDAR